MRILKFALLTLAIIVTSFPISAVRAQAPEPEQEFISQTGHYVRGQFLKQYHRSPNYLTLFGYPITDEIIDPTNGRTVQYFQRARFDLIKDNAGLHIEIAPLGELIYKEGGETRPDLSTSNKCRHFEKTGKSVCLAFLDFYDAYDGQTYLGNPLSDFEVSDGMLVQYFENARMEWHPELTSGQKVVLTDLGRMYFDTRVGDPSFLEPALSNNLIGEPVKIETSAYVSQVLISANQTQIIYVVVQDQYLKPIQGADINIVVTQADGKNESYRLRTTNENGISRMEIPVKESPLLSIVNIQVSAQYQSQTVHTATWFRVW